MYLSRLLPKTVLTFYLLKLSLYLFLSSVCYSVLDFNSNRNCEITAGPLNYLCPFLRSLLGLLLQLSYLLCQFLDLGLLTGPYSVAPGGLKSGARTRPD